MKYCFYLVTHWITLTAMKWMDGKSQLYSRKINAKLPTKCAELQAQPAVRNTLSLSQFLCNWVLHSLGSFILKGRDRDDSRDRGRGGDRDRDRGFRDDRYQTFLKSVLKSFVWCAWSVSYLFPQFFWVRIPLFDRSEIVRDVVTPRERGIDEAETSLLTRGNEFTARSTQASVWTCTPSVHVVKIPCISSHHTSILCRGKPNTCPSIHRNKVWLKSDAKNRKNIWE